MKIGDVIFYGAIALLFGWWYYCDNWSSTAQQCQARGGNQITSSFGFFPKCEKITRIDVKIP